MYRKSSKGWLKHFDFILIDLISLHLAFVLSYVCRHGIGNPYKNLLYRNMAFMLTFIDFFVVFLFETLKGVLRRGYYQELAATVKHVILVMLLAVLYLFTIQEGTSFSRSVLYFTAVFYIIFAYVTRILWKKHLQKRMENGGDRSLLIITSSDIAAEVVRSMQEHNYQRFNLVGIVLVDKDMKGQKIEGIPVLANEEDAANYVCREWIDEVFLVISEKYPYPQKLADQLLETGVTVHLNLAKMADAIGKKQLVEKLGNYTVLTTSINYATVKQTFMKRSLDIIGGLAGCILTGIIFIFVAPAIYIQSPGPIFFSQVRVGKNGKKFKMYKFRSMYMDAEERKKELMKDNRVEDGMMFKLEFDPRVIGNKILPNGEKKTGIGNFIRKTSLDEFPQFLNVLKGDMSLVGTRPPTLDEWEKYELHHRARLPMQIIMPTIIFIGLTNIMGIQMLVPMGCEKIVLYSEIAGAVVDLALNTLLIPRLASAGAAIGTLVAEGVVWIVQFAALRKEVTPAYRNVHYGKVVLSTVVGMVSSGWVKTLGMGNFATLLVSAILFFSGYEKLVKGYTEKQWGRDCKELPAFIIKRLPVRLTFDNNYFNALYQGIPVGGYTKMVENLLEGIEVRLNEDYLTKKQEYDQLAEKVVYTGAIDCMIYREDIAICKR